MASALEARAIATGVDKTQIVESILREALDLSEVERGITLQSLAAQIHAIRQDIDGLIQSCRDAQASD